MKRDVFVGHEGPPSCSFFITLLSFSSTQVGQSSPVDKVGLILASIASFGLMMVGAINEQEDNAVHSGAAVVFFFGFEVF